MIMANRFYHQLQDYSVRRTLLITRRLFGMTGILAKREKRQRSSPLQAVGCTRILAAGRITSLLGWRNQLGVTCRAEPPLAVGVPHAMVGVR
jgi:hypothetical protein